MGFKVRDAGKSCQTSEAQSNPQANISVTPGATTARSEIEHARRACRSQKIRRGHVAHRVSSIVPIEQVISVNRNHKLIWSLYRWFRGWLFIAGRRRRGRAADDGATRTRRRCLWRDRFAKLPTPGGSHIHREVGRSLPEISRNYSLTRQGIRIKSTVRCNDYSGFI